MAISFRTLRIIYEGCGLAVSPGKPRVAAMRRCEERPGAAHSRKDQIV